jgi:hypothetical protein
MEISQKNLTKLQQDAETIATEIDAATEALTERQQAEAALLDRVIALIRPAIRAIGTRPMVAYKTTGHADVNRHRSSEERYDYRVLNITPYRWGPALDNPRDNQGVYEGRDLGLREDGVLVKFVYFGDWSRWQGSSWGWETEITEYTSASAAMADGWIDVEVYIAEIADEIKKAVGSREKTTKSNQKRAQWLSAVCDLIDAQK